MNIYLVNEDGEEVCIRADSMMEAVGVCLQSYLDEQKEQEGEKYNEGTEITYYHGEILKSCSFVGRLGN